MKWTILAALCLVLLCLGCIEQKESSAKSGNGAEAVAPEELKITIASPKDGAILQGERAASFEATVEGGRAPLSYKWSSNIDGELSTSRKFALSPAKMSKGGHVIILKATDAQGNTNQGSIQIDVM